MPLQILAAFLPTLLGALSSLALNPMDDVPPIALELPGPDTLRVEYFLLERLPEDPSDSAVLADPRAVIVLRRVERDGVLTLERDVLFREGGVRVLLDEQLGDGLPQLVWRELRTTSEAGRTWMAERNSALGQIRTQRWGSRAAVHGRLPLQETVIGPLELLEQLRVDQTSPVSVTILDPLGTDLNRLSVRTIHADLRATLVIGKAARELAFPLLTPWTPALLESLGRQGAEVTRAMFGDGARRTVELRRAHQTIAGRYVFEGADLIAFQWQPGRRWARRIDEREYREHLAHWRVRYDPLEDLRRAVRAGFVRRR
jgi:hypothetical protein